ncbi:hypothetical protein [Lacibacter sediminis]|uniref:Uncharacterized protein n=1 Tax=Lacibacter sediminis TaxID=2760713 RepID=A0A7G5XLJ9_9BACT|nr:hypothetical protein [Lacibacter sediminis]QNA46352.1 hypothetical protein H4075_09325 [Lacibacter sediminis]
MTEKILSLIRQDFNNEQRQLVVNELSSIGLKHVMAESTENLESTHVAILKLAKGNVDAVVRYTKSAKADFRDVIMWAADDD